MKVCRYGISVLVESVHISVTFPCKLSVAWKRGNQKLETITQAPLEQGVASFDESLSLNTRIYVDEKKNFQEKKSNFTVMIMTSKGNKVAGICNLNLADLVAQNKPELRQTLKLEKCPDKNATINLKFKFSFISEQDMDQMSQAMSEIDSDEEVRSTTSQNIQNDSTSQKPPSNQVTSSIESVKQKIDFDRTTGDTINQNLVLQTDKVPNSEQNMTSKTLEGTPFKKSTSILTPDKDIQQNNSKQYIPTLKTEYTLLQSQNEKLTKVIEEKENEISNLRVENQNQKNFSTELNQILVEKYNLQEQLSSSTQQSKLDLNNLKAELVENEKHKLNLNTQLEALTKQTKQYETATSQLEESQKQCQSLSNQLSTLASQVQIDSKNLQSQSEEITNLSTKNSLQLDETTGVRRDLESQVSTHLEQIQDLSTSLKVQQEETNSLQNDKSNLKVTLEQIMIELEELKANSIKNNSNNQEQLANHLKVQLEESIGQRENFKMQVESISEQLQSQQMISQALQEEITTLTTDNEKSVVKQEALSDETKSLQSQLQTLMEQTSINTTNSKVEKEDLFSSLQSIKSQMETDTTNHKTQLVDSQKEIDMLNKKLSASTQQIESDSNQINVLTQDSTKLRVQLESSVKDNENSQASIKRLESEASDSKIQFEQTKNDNNNILNQLQTQTDNLQVDANKSTSKLEDVINQNKNLDAQLQSQIAQSQNDTTKFAAQLDEITQEKNQLINETKTLNLNLDIMSHERDTLRQKLQTACEQLKDETTKLNDINLSQGEALKQKTEQYDKLNCNRNNIKLLEDHDTWMNDFKEQITALQKSTNEQLQTGIDVSHDNEKLKIESESKSKQIEMLQNQLGEQKLTKLQKISSNGEIEDQKPPLKKQDSRERHTQKTGTVMVDHRQSIHDSRQSIHDKRQSVHEQMVDEDAQTIERLQAKLTHQEEEKSKLFAKLFNQYKQDIDHSHAQVKDLEHQVERLKEELKSNHMELFKGDQKDAFAQIYAQYKLDLNEAHSTNAELTEKVEELTQEIKHQERLFTKLYNQYKIDSEQAETLIKQLEVQVEQNKPEGYSYSDIDLIDGEEIEVEEDEVQEDGISYNHNKGLMSQEVKLLYKQISQVVKIQRRLFMKVFSQQKADIHEATKGTKSNDNEDGEGITIINIFSIEVENETTHLIAKIGSLSDDKTKLLVRLYKQFESECEQMNLKSIDHLNRVDVLTHKLTSKDEEHLIVLSNHKDILIFFKDHKNQIIKTQQEEINQFIGVSDPLMSYSDQSSSKHITTEDHQKLLGKLYRLYKKDISDANAQVAALNQDVIHLNSDLKAKENLFEKMFTHYKSDIDLASIELRTKEQQIDQLNQQLNLKDASILALTNADLASADENSPITETQQLKNQLKKMKENKNQLFAKLYNQYKGDIETSQQRITALESELFRMHHRENSKVVNSQRSSNKSISPQRPSTDLVDQLQQQIRTQEEDKKKLFAKLYNQYKNDIEATKKEVESLTKQCEQQTTTIDEMKKGLKLAQENSKQLEKTLKLQIEELLKKLKVHESQLSTTQDVQKQLDAQKTSSALGLKVKELTEDRQRLNDQIFSLASEHQKQINLVRRESQSHNEEINAQISDKLNEEISQERIEVMKMLENISELENSKNELDKLYQALQIVHDQELGNLKTSQKKYHEQEEQLNYIKDQLIELKCRLGDVFNVAMTYGGKDLVDMISQAIGLKEFT